MKNKVPPAANQATTVQHPPGARLLQCGPQGVPGEKLQVKRGMRAIEQRKQRPHWLIKKPYWMCRGDLRKRVGGTFSTAAPGVNKSSSSPG